MNNRNQVERIKKMYPAGTRIELISTMDDQQGIEKGTKGTVILVDDELMGVAILTLNDDLTYKELGKIKENVIGQAADGYVPRNNMGQSDIEML